MNSLRSFLALAALSAVTPFILAHDGHDHAAPATAADAYPLTTCVVSGDKLGEMGDPVKYVYKQADKPDRLVEFCCKDCVKDFEKDPAKYLAQLDAAVAGKGAATVAKTSAPAGASDMAGCCTTGDNDACCAAVKSYLPIADALATDDLGKARTAAASFARQVKTAGQDKLYQPALAIVHASDIAAARRSLKSLSAEIEPLVAGNKDYVVMHCPMAEADWVQTGADVRNPYYGKMMLTCGAPKEVAAK